MDASAAPAQSASLVIAQPPMLLVMTAFAVAASGIFMGVLVMLAGKPVPLELGAWVITGPIDVCAFALFSAVTIPEAVNFSSVRPSAAYWAAVAACAVGIGVGAWQIALWVSTQPYG